MGTLFRRFWQPVSLSSRIAGPDGPPSRLRILGENLIAFRDSNGDVGVLQALCPHRRTQLFWGRNEEGGLRCAYHGWKFDVTGQCVDMPTEPPESNYKDRLRTIGYPVVERGGFVWVYMGPRDKEPGFPEYEWLDLPESQRMVFTGLQESNYLQALEGDVDTAHVSYLHRYLHPETAPRPAVFNRGYRDFVGQDVSPRLSVKRTDYGFLYGGRRTLDDGTYYWRCTPWMAPAATYLPTTGDLGQALIRVPIDDSYTLSAGLIWSRTGALPEGPDTTRRVRPVDPGPTRLAGGHVIDLPRGATNLDNDYLIDRAAEQDKFVGIQGGTNAEDRAVTESMGDLDRSQEHLASATSPSSPCVAACSPCCASWTRAPSPRPRGVRSSSGCAAGTSCPSRATSSCCSRRTPTTCSWARRPPRPAEQTPARPTTTPIARQRRRAPLRCLVPHAHVPSRGARRRPGRQPEVSDPC
ncbi:hypothetical protein BJF78_11835 [Pseudonocardia sp. CNS-139]|nr:hypothetical protein BJF78_11835 [Pseudonocardia sp. CNS-139]